MQYINSEDFLAVLGYPVFQFFYKLKLVQGKNCSRTMFHRQTFKFLMDYHKMGLDCS